MRHMKSWDNERGGLTAKALLDRAELLLVSRELVEAKETALEGLSLCQMNSEPSRETPGSPSYPLEGVFLRDLPVALTDCGTSDLFFCVLLQCAFEMKQTYDSAICLDLYSLSKPLPLEVALLWLKLNLANGELHTIRDICSRMCFALLERIKEDSEGQHHGYDHLSETLFKVVDLLIVGVLLPMTEVSAAREVLKRCEGALPEYARTALFDAIANTEEKIEKSLIAGNSDNELNRSSGEGYINLSRYVPRNMLMNSMGFLHGELGEKEWLSWERGGQMALGAGAAVVVAGVAYRSRGSLMRWSKAAVRSFKSLLLGD